MLHDIVHSILIVITFQWCHLHVCHEWRSIVMCNNWTSSGTSLESTPMFAHVRRHRTFNSLGSKCPWMARWRRSFLRTITFLIIHRFLSLKVLLLIYIQEALHTIHFNLKSCFGFGERYLHHKFMAGSGSLLWANTCSLWSGIKSWPGAGCLQPQVRGRWQWPSTSLPYVHYRRHDILQNEYHIIHDV